ncbi:S-layer homology domain-containing protein [Paenibacillus sp. CMAA1364]
MNYKVKSLIVTSLAAFLLTQNIVISSAADTTSFGKWMTGEYHTHTVQSNDASESFMKLENVLNGAFRHNLDSLSPEAKASLTYGQPFDFLVLTDHLRNSPRDPEGNEMNTARWEAIQAQQERISELQSTGNYTNKIIYSGFEWDMMGLDHGSVAIMDSNSKEVPIDAIHQFEYLYSYDTTEDMFTSDEAEQWGPRPSKDELKPHKGKTFEAIEWLNTNYPKSFVLPNHPSRHNGERSGVVTIEDLRKMNDIAPQIVFGMEGMPGNQMAAGKNRAEVTDIYGGADVMIADVGGIWDALLGEGRRFWNFTNSDFHFKVSTNGKYSSGYWPSEYSRNYTWVEGDTFNDVVEGMRSGKSYAVYGDLINALDFNVTGNDRTAEMGEELVVSEGDMTTISIRFKSPEHNNYAPITNHESSVTNNVKVDHIDLISGEITGKIDESDYASNTTNETTQVIERFTEDDWGIPDEAGYYTVSFNVPADSDRYYRLRGTNLGENVEGYISNGEPLKDQWFGEIENNEDRINKINDRNYTNLWFYSNPIFIDVAEDVNEQEAIEPSSSFNDIENHWASSSINYVLNHKLFFGTSNSMFSPDHTLTRGMFVSILHRLADEAETASHDFKDVNEKAYYNDAVSWSSSIGVVKGMDAAHFAPEQSISREQLAQILYNYAKVMNLDTTFNNEKLNFSDANLLSSWATDAMNWSVSQNLLSGKSNHLLDPAGSATRAEAATIFQRFMDRFNL